MTPRLSRSAARQGRLEGLLGDSRARRGGALRRGGSTGGCGCRALPAAGRDRADRARAESATALLERFRAETPADRRSCSRTDVARLELRGARAGRGGAQRPSGSASTLARASEPRVASAFGRSTRRSPSRRAFRRPRGRSPRTVRGWRSGHSTFARRRERAVAAALRSRASAVLADDPAVGLALLQRARAAGLGSLTVLAGRRRRSSSASIRSSPLESLLDVTAPHPSRPRASATTRIAASCGSWARRPRRCCSSYRGGAARSHAEAAELEAPARETRQDRGARQRGACSGRGGGLRTCAAAPRRDDRRAHARQARRARAGASRRDRRRGRAAARFEAPLASARRRRLDAGRRAGRGAADARRDRGESPAGARRGFERTHRGGGRDRTHRRGGGRRGEETRVGRARSSPRRATTAMSSLRG